VSTAPTATSEATGLVLRGRVVGADEKSSLPGALYTYKGDAAPGTPQGWLPTKDGAFEISGLQRGKLVVRAQAPGRAEVTRELSIPQTEDKEVLLVANKPGRTVLISLLDRHGNTLPSKPLQVRLEWLVDGVWRADSVKLAAAPAKETSATPPVGATEVAITAGDPYPRVTLNLRSGDEPIHARLRPRDYYIVSGKVTLTDGSPVESAAVTLRVNDTALRPAARTVESGRYEFSRVGRGKLTVGAAAEGYAPAGPVTVDYDGSRDVTLPTLKLGAGGRLKVSVRLPSGDPAPGDPPSAVHASHTVNGIEVPGGFVRFGPMSADGSYLSEPVTTGEWTITASPNGYDPGYASAVVKSGQTAVVSITVRPHWSLTARVLAPNGKPVSGADAEVDYRYLMDVPPGSGGTVVVQRPDKNGKLLAQTYKTEPTALPNGQTKRIRTGRDGTLSLTDLPGGGESLRIKTPQGYAEIDGIERLATEGGKRPLTVRLQPPATIEGAIAAKGIRLPRRGVAVILSRTNPPRYEPLAEGWDELGRQPDDPMSLTRMVFEPKKPFFRFEGVVPPDNHWTLTLITPDLTMAPVPVNLVPGETTSVTLEATAPGTVRGRIVDSHGKPAPSARLQGTLGGPGKPVLYQLPWPARVSD